MTLSAIASSNLPTHFGDFTASAFRTEGGIEHIALHVGALAERPVVRVHSACLTGEAFGSSRCDCRQQLDAAMQQIQQHGSGVLVYLAQEGRGIGLANKIAAYAKQDEGLDTLDANLALGLPADARDYSVAVDILSALGVASCTLLTNNPLKVDALRHGGLDVTRSHFRLDVELPKRAAEYLATKQARMGHLSST